MNDHIKLIEDLLRRQIENSEHALNVLVANAGSMGGLAVPALSYAGFKAREKAILDQNQREVDALAWLKEQAETRNPCHVVVFNDNVRIEFIANDDSTGVNVDELINGRAPDSHARRVLEAWRDGVLAEHRAAKEGGA